MSDDLILEPLSKHDWQNIRRDELRRVPATSRFGFWLAIACVGSLATHAVLLIIFGGWHIVLPSMQNPDGPLTRLRPVSLPEPAKPYPVTDLPSALESEAVVNQADASALDWTELEKAIPDDREITLTPQVDSPANIGPAKALGPDLDSLNPAALDDALATVVQTNTLSIDASAPLSDQQLVIESSEPSLDAEKARKMIENAGNGGLADRFTTLESLLELPGGRITDTSKPIFVPSDLLFDFAEDRLREEAKNSMMMLGMLIDRNPQTLFIIEGHTDSIGTETNNLDLSRRRAEAVRTWLVQSLLIGQDRIRTEAFGESRLVVAASGDIAAEQPNRRVEIRMVNKAPPSGPPKAVPVPEP